jgi:hypothetical protein
MVIIFIINSNHPCAADSAICMTLKLYSTNNNIGQTATLNPKQIKISLTKAFKKAYGIGVCRVSAIHSMCKYNDRS